MRIVAILQNQWFKNPDGVIKEQMSGPNREWYIKTYLFWGCLTGRRLKQVFGEKLIDEIIWENASNRIGGRSNSVFPADRSHILAVLTKHKPTHVLAFGKIATTALQTIKGNFKLITGPHPAARDNVIPELYCMKKELLNVE